MQRQIVVFKATDASLSVGLWETNGTAAGTHELTGVSGANPAGLFPFGSLAPPDFTVFNGEVLFEGSDASNDLGL